MRLLQVLAVAALFWAAAAFVMYRQHLPERHLSQCVENLHIAQRALTRYAADHHGRFPPRLAGLTPDYLPGPLTCPAAGENSYIYHVSGSDITVVCWGPNHYEAHAQADFPRLCIPPGEVEVHCEDDLEDP